MRSGIEYGLIAALVAVAGIVALEAMGYAMCAAQICQ